MKQSDKPIKHFTGKTYQKMAVCYFYADLQQALTIRQHPPSFYRPDQSKVLRNGIFLQIALAASPSYQRLRNENVGIIIPQNWNHWTDLDDLYTKLKLVRSWHWNMALKFAGFDLYGRHEPRKCQDSP